MRLNLVKHYTLVPEDDETAEAITRLKDGEVITADFKKIREPWKHRKYFVMIKRIWDNLPEAHDVYGNQETLRKALQIAAGYVDQEIHLDGSVVLVARSIAYHKMDQTEFEKLYNDVLNAALKHFSFDHEFEQELVRF